MAVVSLVLAAVSPWRVAWYGVAAALFAVGQAILWPERRALRAALRDRPEPSRGREARRVTRRAVSGRLIPEEEVADVRLLVAWKLRMWDSPRRLLGHFVSSAAIVWWGGLPATFALLRGRLGAAVILLAFPALVLAVDLPLARQLVRMRRTAKANGWLVDSRVADDP